MARVTVEDCVDKVPNRFDLVLLAAQRAREISGGAEITLERDRDKNPVVALRVNSPGFSASLGSVFHVLPSKCSAPCNRSCINAPIVR